ncbi:MAG: hypothetical protein GY711_16950 [bacterium]|nr:hypothetical protein [bacterium]
MAGLHAFERISPGPYVYVVGGAGYWPTEHQVTASKDPAELEVQVRRVGTLEIEAIHAGAAVAAAQAAIRSVEYDKDVRTWAGRGFASVEPADSRTDSSGLLVVQDIPNGPYTWTVTFPDGHVATGNVTVPPHSRTRVRAER